MSTIQAITDFQHACQKYYICHTFARLGLADYAKKLASGAKEPDKKLIVGTGHPDAGRWHASMKIGEAIESSQADGAFSNKIAKSFIVAMYSEWDEVYRHQVALEVGVVSKAVKCDLMGDLRLLRHCIVHNKSIIADEQSKVRELKWPLLPGKLAITDSMFSQLIDQINRMLVRVEPERMKG
jgi:hypothetical protein